MKHPRLRDSKKLITNEPYPMNELPDDLIVRIGGYLAHLLYVGRKDITGTDWGDAFADAVEGKHLDSPIGIADVVLGKMAWSVKTVKNARPFNARSVRLISGRCSPDYSYGITDPHADIQNTGRAGNHTIFRHANFIGCLSADKIKMPVRKYFCFNIPVYRNMAEEPSCRSPYHEEYIQTSVSGNSEGLCRSTYSFLSERR